MRSKLVPKLQNSNLWKSRNKVWIKPMRQIFTQIQIEVQNRRCHMIGHKERQHRQYRQYLSVDIGFNSLRSVYFSLISSPRKLLWCLLCYCLVIINGHRRHSKTRRELVKYRWPTEFSFFLQNFKNIRISSILTVTLRASEKGWKLQNHENFSLLAKIDQLVGWLLR